MANMNALDVSLYVPTWVRAGLDTGDFTRRGGTIRWSNNGRIVTHLADAAKADVGGQPIQRLIATMARNPGVTGAGVFMVAGVASVFSTRLRQAQGAVDEYMESLRGLVEAAGDGDDVDHRDRLNVALASLERRSKDPFVRHLLSGRQAELMGLLADLHQNQDSLRDTTESDATVVEMHQQRIERRPA